MERVQFQQEQMLAELKDLVEKNLFTVKETRLMLQRRTEMERSLVRRVSKKSDFLRYIEYERGMEALRRKRVERIIDKKGPATVSDYALVRRQFHIFERALKKFKDDVGLWIQYIELAKKEGARTLVGRVCARAIQLHPNCPGLYILAASHELQHASPSAARTLLQRGIRLNSNSIELWREYVKMEMGFVEGLRRRWEVLGISEPKGKQRAVADIDLDKELVDEGETDVGAAARREIMDGAIVKSVISNAFQAMATMELFEALERLITEFPSTSPRAGLMSHLHAVLGDTLLPNSAKALQVILMHTVQEEMDELETVEGIRTGMEIIMSCARDSSIEKREPILEVCTAFIFRWAGGSENDEMRKYLMSHLELLFKRNKGSESLSTAMKKAQIDNFVPIK
ncbi:U3 small nucleolar RNA-associated protein 6-domain-containing protein [Mycena floridula]|nr:U3 small nucleolar RNA-associated protein 6-domain-containing protein [Mycena floridula]